MIDHKQYAYRVIWSDEDAEFVGLCAEFPSLSHLASQQSDALEGIVTLVGEIVADMAANGETLPDPLSGKRYSGKFQVRMPPEQHRNLAIKAAEQGISLNRLVSSLLTA